MYLSIYIYKIKVIFIIIIWCILSIFICYRNVFSINPGKTTCKEKKEQSRTLKTHEIRAQIKKEQEQAKKEGTLEAFNKKLKEQKAQEQKARVAAWKAKKREEKKLNSTPEENARREAFRQGQLKRIARRKEVQERIAKARKEGNLDEVKKQIAQEEKILIKKRDLGYKEKKQQKILANNPPSTEDEKKRRMAISKTQTKRHANDKILAKKEEELIKVENPKIVKEKIKKEKVQRIKQNRSHWTSTKRATKRAKLPETEREKTEARSQGQLERQKRHKEIEQRKEQAKKEGTLKVFTQQMIHENRERKRQLKNRQLECNAKKHAAKQEKIWATLPENEKKRRMKISQTCLEYHKNIKPIKQKARDALETGDMAQFLDAFSNELELKGKIAKKKTGKTSSTQAQATITKQSEDYSQGEKSLIQEEQNPDETLLLLTEGEYTLVESEIVLPFGIEEENPSQKNQNTLLQFDELETFTLELINAQGEEEITAIGNLESTCTANPSEKTLDNIGSSTPPLQVQEQKLLTVETYDDYDNNNKEISESPLIQNSKIPLLDTPTHTTQESKYQLSPYLLGYDKQTQESSLQNLQALLYSPREQLLDKLKIFVLQANSTPEPINLNEKNIVQSLSNHTQYHFFGYNKNNTKNLENKPCTSQLGLTTKIKSAGSFCLIYHRDKNKIYSSLSNGTNSLSSPTQSNIDVHMLSNAITLNNNHLGFKGHLVNSYGWGQMKNIRYTIHNKREICTKGKTAINLYSTLCNLSYTLPLTASITFTPYIENFHVQIAWKGYNEYFGPLPCKISSYKERLDEKSIGLELAWTNDNDWLLQAWIAKNFRRHTTAPMSSRPLMSPNSSLYLATIPCSTKKYTQHQIGISYKKQMIEKVFITLDSTFSYTKGNNKQEIEYNIEYLF